MSPTIQIQSRPNIALPDTITTTIPATAATPVVAVRLGLGSNHYGHQCYMPAEVSYSSPVLPVTASVVRSVATHQDVVAAVRMVILHDPQNAHYLKRPHIKAYARGRAGRAVHIKHHENPSDRYLTDASIVYRTARLSRDTSIIALMRTFHIPRSVAMRWIRLAKRHGLIAA